MQDVIVHIVVILAAAYLVWQLVPRRSSAGGACASCASCGASAAKPNVAEVTR